MNGETLEEFITRMKKERDALKEHIASSAKAVSEAEEWHDEVKGRYHTVQAALKAVLMVEGRWSFMKDGEDDDEQATVGPAKPVDSD